MGGGKQLTGIWDASLPPVLSPRASPTHLNFHICIMKMKSESVPWKEELVNNSEKPKMECPALGEVWWEAE